MEMMNDLLEKYFRGETSLAEEKTLKHYFSNERISPEHEVYRALFDVFKQELNVTGTSPLHKVLPKQRVIKRIWIQTFAYTGIAASLILLLWIRFPQGEENFAVIGGDRIDNPEYVQRYTAKKLTNVNRILARSMRPLQSFNNVRKNMEPLDNLSDVKGKMKNIQTKLQFK